MNITEGKPKKNLNITFHKNKFGYCHDFLLHYKWSVMVEGYHNWESEIQETSKLVIFW